MGDGLWHNLTIETEVDKHLMVNYRKEMKSIGVIKLCTNHLKRNNLINISTVAPPVTHIDYWRAEHTLSLLEVARDYGFLTTIPLLKSEPFRYLFEGYDDIMRETEEKSSTLALPLLFRNKNSPEFLLSLTNWVKIVESSIIKLDKFALLDYHRSNL